MTQRLVYSLVVLAVSAAAALGWRRFGAKL